MKSLGINSGLLPAVVSVPSSKSYANRALVLAALRSDSFTIGHLPSSSDVMFLLNAFEQIGLILRWHESNLTIVNSFPACEKEGVTIEIGEGGTTARFLAALLLRGNRPYTLVLGDRLKERPWSEFISFVQNYGGKAQLKGNQLIIQGPLKLPQEVSVDCSRTTQFASGIQLAFAWSGVKVKPTNLDSSQSYWGMTEYLIHSLHTKCEYQVPLDWSSASYALAFGALNHKISFPNLFFDKFQADAKFYHLLKSLSCLTESNEGVEVAPIKEFKNCNLDISDCLDLVPTLCYFLAYIDGTHRLSGVKNLRFKESDRLEAIMILLSNFERKVLLEDDTLIIYGNNKRFTKTVNLVMPNDHRMVMAGTLFLRHNVGGEIFPVDSVTKSYPDFFKLLI